MREPTPPSDPHLEDSPGHHSVAAEEIAERIQIEVHLDPDDEAKAKRELREALAESPRRIPTRFLYDDRGSELFERICELPEYYPTRTEAAILERSADAIVAVTGAQELVEIGSGAATKTPILLSAMERAGKLQLYVPLDVSEGIVRRSSRQLAERYPGMEIRGVVGDFMRHLEEIPSGRRRLFAFLGGTIGNLTRDAAAEFLGTVGREMEPGDHLLLGTDLIKEVGRIEAAYNDAQGVTAAFNLNILRVVNDFVGGDFDPVHFHHRAFFEPEEKRIEMRLVVEEDHTVHLPGIDTELELAAGEELLTEISTKYDRERIEALLEASGFTLRELYTDAERLFALSLAQPR